MFGVLCKEYDRLDKYLNDGTYGISKYQELDTLHQYIGSCLSIFDERGTVSITILKQRR